MHAYKRVIEMLMNQQVDHYTLMVKLAQNYPEIFLELTCNAVVWHQTVINLLKTEQNVEAIKIVRKETGYGLKESKDVCDNLRWNLVHDGVITSQSWWAEAVVLNPKLEELRKLIYEGTTH